MKARLRGNQRQSGVGHGIAICRESEFLGERIVAFVAGFAWHRGAPNITVLYDPTLVPQEENEFVALKSAFEAQLVNRDAGCMNLIPGYYSWSNC